jgi:transaldolase
MKTKIFCDSADLKVIKNLSKNKLIKGFTTNPSLMKLSGAKNYKNYALKLLKASNNKPISFEVFADEFDLMINQANKIKMWGKNVYVKIPIVNTKGVFTGKVIRTLSQQKIKLNITAVYKVSQVKKILKNINKNSKVIISIFAGRMGDAGKNPIPIIKESVNLTKKLKNVEILWASTREAYNYMQAKQCGCSIITTPPQVIYKILKFGNSLEYLTIDTVKKFLIDSKKSNFKL